MAAGAHRHDENARPASGRRHVGRLRGHDHRRHAAGCQQAHAGVSLGEGRASGRIRLSHAGRRLAILPTARLPVVALGVWRCARRPGRLGRRRSQGDGLHRPQDHRWRSGSDADGRPRVCRNDPGDPGRRLDVEAGGSGRLHDWLLPRPAVPHLRQARQKANEGQPRHGVLLQGVGPQRHPVQLFPTPDRD